MLKMVTFDEGLADNQKVKYYNSHIIIYYIILRSKINHLAQRR